MFFSVVFYQQDSFPKKQSVQIQSEVFLTEQSASSFQEMLWPGASHCVRIELSELFLLFVLKKLAIGKSDILMVSSLPISFVQV